MGKYVISALFAFLFTLLPTVAQAQWDFGVSTEDIDASVESGEAWTSAQLIELGPEVQFQFALAKPEALDGGYAVSTHFVNFDYLTSYALGFGFVGPQLRLGWNYAWGTNNVTGESVDAHTFAWAPGIINGLYVHNNWLIIQRLSLPFIMEDPGFEFDLAASYTPVKRFAIECGLSLGYAQTDLEVPDENGENMYAKWGYIGFYTGLVFEPWGEYELGL